VPIVLAHHRSLLLCLLQRRPLGWAAAALRFRPVSPCACVRMFMLRLELHYFHLLWICCTTCCTTSPQQSRNKIELTELQPQRRTGGGILRPPCRRNIEFLFSFFLANGATPRPWWSVAPRFDRSSLNEANNPVAKTWRSHHAARYWVWVRSKRPRSKTAPTVVR